MKVLITDKGLACQHKTLMCQDCGSVAYKEKPGRARSMQSFLRLARRVAKTLKAEERYEKQG